MKATLIIFDETHNMDQLPDLFCKTLPNGDCISDDQRCIHQPNPGRGDDNPAPIFIDDDADK
jgi:hypothetical protein